MKSRIIVSAVVVFILAVFSITNLSAADKATAKTSQPAAAAQPDKGSQAATSQGSQSAIESFQNSKAWNKLDSTLQDGWVAAMKAGDQMRRFDCFVRVEAPYDQGDEAFLVSNGFIVQQAAGPVATGHVAAKDMQSVAELPFVRKINSTAK